MLYNLGGHLGGEGVTFLLWLRLVLVNEYLVSAVAIIAVAIDHTSVVQYEYTVCA